MQKIVWTALLALCLAACSSGEDTPPPALQPAPATGSTTVSPAGFAFESVTSAAVGVRTQSDIVAINGFAGLASVQMDAGANTPEFRVCADAACNVVRKDWQDDPRDLSNDAYLQVRLTSAASTSADSSLTVRVGSTSASFTVSSTSYCEQPFTQTGHLVAGSSIHGQDGWTVDPAALFDEQVQNLGALAPAGQNAWRLGNKVVSGGFGNQPLSAPLAESAGESTVRSAGGGDAMEAVFWVRPVSPVADGSSIVISFSPQAGDRLSYFRVLNDTDAHGGFQTRVIDYLGVASTNAFRTNIAASGMSRTAWTKVRMVMQTPDGGSNDTFSIYLNDVLAGVYSTWEDYNTWALGGNAITLAVNRMLFRMSVLPSTVDPSFADANAQGFYFDQLCYRIYNAATPGTTISAYRTGFEP